MKKLITVLLVGLMVFGSFSAVFAEEPNDTEIGSFLDEGQQDKVDKAEMKALKEEQKLEKLSLAKEFIDEIHQINALRVERNELQIQVIEKHDQLLDLYIAARESGNKEALEAAKQERSKLNGINAQIEALHQQAQAAKETFKEELKKGNKEAAQAAIDRFIDIHTSINNKAEEKVEVLGAIVDILS